MKSLLIVVLVLLCACGNTGNYTWSCDNIKCNGIVLEGATIGCGNYDVWEHKCNMINCTKPIKCKKVN